MQKSKYIKKCRKLQKKKFFQKKCEKLHNKKLSKKVREILNFPYSQEQSQATYVSKYSDDGLSLQQKKEQQELMPAPNHPVSGGFHKQDYTGQDEDPEDIDALTPSINNYQPQVVSDTLERDAASFLNSTPQQQLQMQNPELFHTQYIIGNDEHNQNTTPVKK